MKILSIQELLEKKGVLKDRQQENFTIDVKDVGAFEFRLPTLAETEEMNGFSDAYMVGMLMLNPNLSESVVLESFQAQTVGEVVEQMFLPGEIRRIAERILEKAGYSDNRVQIAKEVKNA